MEDGESQADGPKRRQRPSPTFLQFSETDWDLLRDAIVAAEGFERVAWRQSLYRLRDQHEDRDRLSFWAWCLLWLRIAEMKGPKPSARQLRKIGRHCERRYRMLLAPHDPPASKVLLFTFDRVPVTDDFPGPNLIVQRIALLSQLLDDSAVDTERLRPDVERMWQQKGPWFEDIVRQAAASSGEQEVRPEHFLPETESSE